MKSVDKKVGIKSFSDPTQGAVPSFFTSPIWEDKSSLSFKLKQIIFQAVLEVAGKNQGLKSDILKLEHPSQNNYGDYATNIALILAGKMHLKPYDLAKKIADQLNKYISDNQKITISSDSKKSQDNNIYPSRILEKIEIGGGGFINLWLREDYLITLLGEVLKEKNGVRITQMIGKKVAVEYTDPNPFKEFHLGHMYSNFIGESVSRLFEACGAKVWRGDFYGDVGMHVAKSVWGMMEKMAQEKITLDDLNNLSIKERQKFLGRCYAAGVRKFEEDKTIQEKIRELNSLIYVAGQEALRKSKDWQPIVDYRQYIVGREEMLPKVQRIYEAGLHWSLEYFETIYQRLRTKFDGYYPESWAGEYGMKLVEKGLKIGALEKSEGTVVYRGEKDGLHTRVFVNKLGLPTYEAKDLGLALAKYQDFKYDVSINVFGREIDEYYKVVRAAMRKIIPELGSKAYYIAHGMVRLPEGKMSSRTGNVVTFEWLLDEAKKYALKIMKDIDLGEAEKQTVAQEVGVGAVRYALLKNSPGNDVVFDFDKSVSFEGDSGPYLMYTYARCKSVIRKANDLNSKLKSLSRAQSRDQNSKVQLKTQKSESAKDTWKVTLDGSFQVEEAVKYLNSEELSLLRAIYRFPEVVVESTRTLSPNLVCSFLFDLAQKYNLFYNKHSILNPAPRHIDGKTPGRWPAHSYAVVAGLLPGGGISKSLFEVEGSEDADYRVKSATFRLALTAATAQILKQGLYLLGIETVERM